jgi:Tfp pilus assembly protein PilW
MKPQAGFTLIEVLTTGMISTIVGSALLSVFYMCNAHIRAGGAALRLVQMQTIASERSQWAFPISECRSPFH